MNRLIIILGASVVLSPVVAQANQPLSPAEEDSLYYLHVLFRWDQISNSASYNLQVAIEGSTWPFEDSLVVDVLDSTTTTIVYEGLEWDKSYLWRVRGIDFSGEPGEWQETHSFSIRDIPEDFKTFHVEIYDSSQYCEGITLFECFAHLWAEDPHTFGVDMYGRVIWYGPPPFRADARILDSGHIIALRDNRIEITNLNNQLVWQSDAMGFHHEVEVLPNGDFLSLVMEVRPVVTWGDTALWQGDVILEIDSNSDTVWSWHCFDHISLLDFDSVALANVPPGEVYDWTHGNACTYDTAENVIYYSSRNLSRIIKIDRATGEKIWSMGARMASGEADFGDSLFWFQHAPKPLSNGHLLIYNNNNPFLVPRFSSAMEIAFDFSQPEPATVSWEYVQENFSIALGEADRLPNGNTLICAGAQAFLLEVNAEGEEIWRLPRPVWSMYRSEREASLYAQAFSIITPDMDSIIEPGPGQVYYRLFNEGTVGDTFSVSFYDSRGWFESVTNEVIVAGGSSTDLIFQYETPPVNESDSLYLTVISALNPESVDFSQTCVWTFVEAIVTQPSTAYKMRFGPNPFNEILQISLNSPIPVGLRIAIFNTAGQCVYEDRNDYLSVGSRIVRWDGSRFASGSYYLRIQVGDEIQMRRVVLLK